MAETLRIVFSKNNRQRRPAPLLILDDKARLSAALLRLLDTYSRKARQALLQPSPATLQVLMRALQEG